jgi:hypothetical protein
VFVTRGGKRQPITGVAQRLKGAIRKANGRLDELGIEPISERVTRDSRSRSMRAPSSAGLSSRTPSSGSSIGHLNGQEWAIVPALLEVGLRSRPKRAKNPASLSHNQTYAAPWRSGYAAACKAVYTGSIPVGASRESPATAGSFRALTP